MDWNVIYVKPRNEKKVAASLSKIGITVYCPLVTEVHQWSDRKKKVKVPLLKSYVFVQLKENERDMVFQIPGVVRYLFWLGKPAIVRDSEVKLMQHWLTHEHIQTNIENVQPGDRINIQKGFFEGRNGVVQQINKNRIQILLPDLEMKITLNRT